jgi:hypothetical protein
MKYKKGDLVVYRSDSNSRGVVVEAEWSGIAGDNRYRILWATPIPAFDNLPIPAFDNLHWYYEEDRSFSLVGEPLD